MKAGVPLSNAYRLINHGPVLLLSTRRRGRANVCAVSWVTPVDADLVAVVLSEENDSFRSVMETGEFVLNVPNRSLLRQVVGCGSVSGRECDKFRRFGLTPTRARRVRAPRVAECIGHLECRVLPGGARLARRHNLFIARVVAAAAERGLFTKRWMMRSPRARSLHHLGGNVFAVPDGRELR
ncbi:MAG: flavin reductase family protein [bacterium]|nr:flavin reductase family protein [bacterium]